MSSCVIPPCAEMSRTDVRFGSKADICAAQPMPALSPKADMCSAPDYVRFGPKADLDRQLLDHFVSAGEQLERHGEAERLPFRNGVPAPVAFQLAFERGAVIEAVKA
jgi:hypothetical protein